MFLKELQLTNEKSAGGLQPRGRFVGRSRAHLCCFVAARKSACQQSIGHRPLTMPALPNAHSTNGHHSSASERNQAGSSHVNEIHVLALRYGREVTSMKLKCEQGSWNRGHWHAGAKGALAHPTKPHQHLLPQATMRCNTGFHPSRQNPADGYGVNWNTFSAQLNSGKGELSCHLPIGSRKLEGYLHIFLRQRAPQLSKNSS